MGGGERYLGASIYDKQELQKERNKIIKATPEEKNADIKKT